VPEQGTSALSEELLTAVIGKELARFARSFRRRSEVALTLADIFA